MSPEQAMQDEIRIDHRSDIYSLGALLYELVTGRPLIGQEALEQQKLEDIVSAIASQRSPLSLEASDTQSERTELNSSVEWILEKAIQNDPVERYDSVDQFKKDVESAIDDPKEFLSHRRATVELATTPSSTCRVKQVATWTRNHLWQAMSLCILVAFVIAFGMQPFVECPSAKNSSGAESGRSVLENIICDSHQELPGAINEEIPSPQLQKVQIESFFVKPADKESFAFRGRQLNIELCSEKAEEVRERLVKPRRKVRWMTESKPRYSLELARELPKAAQKQAIIHFQQVVEKLDEPQLRHVKSLIQRIPHKTLYRCRLDRNEAVEIEAAIDSTDF